MKWTAANLAKRHSPHEVRLLGMLAEGYSYQAAADHFHVSINTVRDYIRSIYDKLHVHSKTEAVRKAIANRIIPSKRQGLVAGC